MSSPPDDHRIIEFDRLNLVGKAVYVTGAVVHATAQAIDTVLGRTVDLVLEAERAFKEGRDSDVEDAKVLQEWDKDR